MQKAVRKAVQVELEGRTKTWTWITGRHLFKIIESTTSPDWRTSELPASGFIELL